MGHACIGYGKAYGNGSGRAEHEGVHERPPPSSVNGICVLLGSCEKRVEGEGGRGGSSALYRLTDLGLSPSTQGTGQNKTIERRYRSKCKTRRSALSPSLPPPLLPSDRLNPPAGVPMVFNSPGSPRQEDHKPDRHGDAGDGVPGHEAPLNASQERQAVLADVRHHREAYQGPEVDTPVKPAGRGRGGRRSIRNQRSWYGSVGNETLEPFPRFLSWYGSVGNETPGTFFQIL